MPNDAVVDPTVHHLFAEVRCTRGKSSRSWPGENPADHGQGKIQQITATIPTMPFLKPTISRLHDARRFWRQGHMTFSGFIKARERPLGKKKQKKGTDGGRVERVKRTEEEEELKKKREEGNKG
jgi:hypothetical protein